MRTLIEYRKKIVVFWSMKAACTSLTSWYFHRYLPNTYDVDTLGWIKGKPPRIWLLENGYITDEATGMRLVKDMNFRSIAWVRHPLSRAISGYVNKFVNYNGTALKSLDQLEYFARDLAIGLYNHYDRDLDNYTGFSFREFLDYIHSSMQNGKAPDPHWAPQMQWAYDTNPFRRVLWVEDAAKCRKVIRNHFQHPFKVHKANKSDYGDKITEKLDDRPATDLIPLYGQFGQDNFITEQTIALTQSIYGQDFKHFGYDALPPVIEDPNT